MLSLVLLLCLIPCVRVSRGNLTVFDEIVVYEPGFALGTISFAPNGTLFFNHGYNIYNLVNGNAASVDDIRPEKKDYYEFGQYYGIAVAPNGTLYASVNDGSYGLICEVVDGKISNETKVYERFGSIKEISFNPKGELFYTDGDSIFSVVEGCLFNKTFFGGNGPNIPLSISSIAFAPDGTLFVCVTYGYWLSGIPMEQYAIIWKVVENNLQWVHVRTHHGEVQGIDDIAISPNGEIFFEDYAPPFPPIGCLYELAPKTCISLENALFFFYKYPVATNSTVLGYKYNFTQNALKLNLTGSKGTRGAIIITIFAEHFGRNELDFEVEIGEQPVNHNEVKSRDYSVYFTYDHEEQIPLTITLQYEEPPWENMWIYVTYASVIVLTMAIAVTVVLRKKRLHKGNTRVPSNLSIMKKLLQNNSSTTYICEVHSS